MQTDGVLANAIAYLLDPKCNVIPNSGFEENTGLDAKQSNWVLCVRKQAKCEWRQEGASEGKVFARIASPNKASSGRVHPFYPIVVERGATYTFACQYRSSAPWQVWWHFFKGPQRTHKPDPGPTVTPPASTVWTRFETKLAVPADVRYVRPTIAIDGQGELCVDAVTLCME